MAVQTRLQTREDRVAERAFRPSFIHLFAPLCERTKQSQRTSRKKEQERGLRIRAEKMCPLASPPSVTDYDDGVTVTRQERRIPRETGSSRRVPSSDRVSPPPALSTAVRNFQADATARANDGSRSPRCSRGPFVGITKLTLRPLETPGICGCLTGSLLQSDVSSRSSRNLPFAGLTPAVSRHVRDTTFLDRLVLDR